MSYYECTTVFSVSVDIYVSLSTGAVCVCAWCHSGSMFVWEHGYPSVWIQSHLLQTSADWTLRPTPARSKMSFRWAVSTNRCFSTKIMLFFLCRLLLKMWTYHQYNSEHFAQQNNVNEYVQRENCSFITQKYRPKTLLWIAYLRPLFLEELDEKCLSS